MTVQEYINLLPLPIRERWWKNVKTMRDAATCEYLQEQHTDSFYRAMGLGFVFAYSPEGEQFWQLVRKSVDGRKQIEHPQQWLKEIQSKFDFI